MIWPMSGETNDWMDRLRAENGLPESYASNVIDHLRPLAERILDLRHDLARPVVVGINGGQGSGKSTFSLFLLEWLKHHCKLSAAILSLDDLYYSQQKRKELALEVHPLLATRGVPGTHDIALGMRLLDGLTGTQESDTLAMPTFNKATDDLYKDTEWRDIQVPVDVVIFEGWCVGARPQPESELEAPINELESAEDPNGYWRRAVNEHLQSDYAELFRRIDCQVMLRIPSFEKGIEWRRLQESKLSERMSEARLMRFMMHYERLTRHMLATGPSCADTVIDINDRHQMVRMDQGFAKSN